MDTCLSPFDSLVRNSAIDLAHRNDLDGLKALPDDAFRETACCFTWFNCLHSAVLAGNHNVFRHLLVERGVKSSRYKATNPGLHATVSLSKLASDPVNASRAWVMGGKKEDESFEKLEDRRRIRQIVENGFIPIAASWNVQRLLWIGRHDSESPFSMLPRDIIRMLVMKCSRKCIVFGPVAILTSNAKVEPLIDEDMVEIHCPRGIGSVSLRYWSHEGLRLYLQGLESLEIVTPDKILKIECSLKDGELTTIQSSIPTYGKAEILDEESDYWSKLVHCGDHFDVWPPQYALMTRADIHVRWIDFHR